jgi:hypothetical protein
VTWKGREISSPGDYVHALLRIETVDEADEFREQMMRDAAIDRKIADRNIGYLTGEMSAEDRRRVCELFAVQHPISGDLEDLTFGELLTLGGTFAEARVGGYDFDAAALRARLHIRTLREVRARTTTNGSP